MENNKTQLATLSRPLKTLCVCYILTLLVGYSVSLLQVYNKSQFNMKEAVTYYKGDKPTDSEEIQIHMPKPYSALLSVAHVHTLSQPMLFALLSFIYCFSTATDKKKTFLIILLYSGSFISNLSPFLLRYSWDAFVYALPFSQFMIAISLFSMSFRSLKEILCVRKNETA